MVKETLHWNENGLFSMPGNKTPPLSWKMPKEINSDNETALQYSQCRAVLVIIDLLF